MGTHLSLTSKTPDKMRVLLALTLLVAGALAGGKEKREMEMWMKMKAMEGCFGEDLVKDHMIKMKRSAAKCTRVEAPELELPMFENSFRFANAMSRTPRRGMGMGGKKSMMKTFMMMQMFSDMMDSGSNRLQKRSHHEGMLGDCPWGGEMVKTKMYMKCMMKKKVKTCMRKDIKDKLEEHFGGVDKLVTETKIPEYELYEIVKQMLKGPEMMMMEMS